MQVTEVDSLALCITRVPGSVGQFLALAVGKDRAGIAEREVHVVRQIQDASVWACVIHAIVSGASRGVVSCSGKHPVSHPAQPALDVDHLVEGVIESSSGSAHVLAV